MGLISDQFKRDLEEMQARHAVSERRLAESRDRVFEALAEIKAIVRDMEEA